MTFIKLCDIRLFKKHQEIEKVVEIWIWNYTGDINMVIASLYDFVARIIQPLILFKYFRIIEMKY